eukprot:TRINITY_DN11920_c0_g1_i1.p3 TRINITY_DN11920_c0_g1~~TRINITY_DN11920_c0_g1_i1.p3  ORF type:complete len:51 (-),score=3.81 TRINITY_DN11920_c0_g1_i1:242-394(-)
MKIMIFLYANTRYSTRGDKKYTIASYLHKQDALNAMVTQYHRNLIRREKI